jgi:glyoxylase-like metal-dependent hydrolase (beta-lactamase superfamily II)
MKKIISALFVCVASIVGVSYAQALKHQIITPTVHALIGEIGGRTYQNHGLNANFGFIDTKDGVILIDSGASYQGAQLIDQEIQKIAKKKVKWVINTGSQDHRWLGNDYFSSQGAQIIALSRTVKTQQSLAIAQMDSLRPALKERLDKTKPTHAKEALMKDDHELTLGGVVVQLKYLDHAHFAGDIVVYLPGDNILFSGDHIYIDRILGVLPQSDASRWLQAFSKIEAMKPKVIIPGHGSVTNMTKAKQDTGDYLNFLVSGCKKYADEMAGVEAAVKNLAKAPAFERLANFNDLHLGNVSRTYLKLESQ